MAGVQSNASYKMLDCQRFKVLSRQAQPRNEEYEEELQDYVDLES